jgi:ABC-type Fe3+/spermidine/putrescine transport system ATPase subunit
MRGLRVEGLRVAFGERSVLDGLDLTVAPGERVAVLGPSGCGKSTLLRTIAGLQAPVKGLVLLDDDDVTDRPPEHRGIGLLFQRAVLYPHRDVAGNLALGLPRGLARDERRRRIAAALEEVNLEGFEARDVTTLSGGEGQRVALARALLAEPRALLLDEPFSALDGTLRRRLVETTAAVLQERSLPAVHVTHDPDEAEAFADRVFHMEGGRLSQRL